MDKLVKLWLTREMTCAGNDIVASDLIDISTIFVLLCLGIAMSGMVLGVEKIAKKSIKVGKDLAIENGHAVTLSEPSNGKRK